MPDLHDFGVDRMTVDERLSLISAIWATIASETQTPLISDDVKKLLDQRLADHAAHPDDVVPWEESFAKAMSQCRK
ncbi:MAG TPA: addiction module protein [Pirellulales bacterium]